MQLSGPAKAAVFLLSLPEERAVQIIQHMSEAELRTIHRVAESVGNVTASVINDVFNEFVESYKAGLTSMSGTTVYLQNLVQKARGDDEALRLFAETDAKAERVETGGPLAAFRGANPQVLAATMSAEHPQVAAAILAHLDRDLAGRVLKELQPERQLEVLRRMARLTSIPASAFSDAQQALAGIELSTDPLGEVDGASVAAEILGTLDAASADQLLERMKENSPDEATAVRQAMFTFESLTQVSKRDLQNLLREIQSDTLMVALKTASDELKGQIFACMSSRAAEMLKEELEMMAPVRLSEVETAQLEIVEVAMRLAGEGKMSIGGRGEEMV